jgi:hypothetical protein
MKGDSEMDTTNARPSIRYIHIVCFLSFMAVSSPSFAGTQWDVGISGGSEGIDGFTLSIGEYYGVPAREVIVIHDRGIYEEELPVVFHIARRAHVCPGTVVDLRLRGMSWMDITLYFGLSPEIYYVPVVVHHYHHYGPRCGHAYGYYHKHPRGGWSRNELRDRDIVNQVNLKFMAEHHRYAPEKIMRYRSDGRSFRTIDRDIIYEKNGRPKYQKQNRTYQNDQRQGQDKMNLSRPKQNVLMVSEPKEDRKNQDIRKKYYQHGYVQVDRGKSKNKRWQD